jgi:hypothetical protein
MRAPEVGVRHFPDQIWLSVDAARTISERSAIFFVQAMNARSEPRNCGVADVEAPRDINQGLAPSSTL